MPRWPRGSAAGDTNWSPDTASWLPGLRHPNTQSRRSRCLGCKVSLIIIFFPPKQFIFLFFKCSGRNTLAGRGLP